MAPLLCERQQPRKTYTWIRNRVYRVKANKKRDMPDNTATGAECFIMDLLSAWRVVRQPVSLAVASGKRAMRTSTSISGLVVEYIVAIDVTRVRFPADAHS